jgi:hypothetical protein
MSPGNAIIGTAATNRTGPSSFAIQTDVSNISLLLAVRNTDYTS